MNFQKLIAHLESSVNNVRHWAFFKNFLKTVKLKTLPKPQTLYK